MLVSTDSLQMDVPAALLSSDGESLLVLEAAGERILVLDARLSVTDTLVLTRRLAVPRGMAADVNNVYLYDDAVLYRYDRRRRELTAMVSNLRAAGLACYAPGEVLVSDEVRGVVWRKGFFGESRLFLSASEIPRPGAIAALGDGSFVVASGPGRISLVNRVGIVERTLTAPQGLDRISPGPRGYLFLYAVGCDQVLAISPGNREWIEFSGVRGITALTYLSSRIVVLDNSTRLLAFDFPCK